MTDPLGEPMIHKDFPGGLEDLQEYVMEVCEGIKDHVVRDPEEYQRIVAYVLNNPVKAGLVQEWKDWPWSYFDRTAS